MGGGVVGASEWVKSFESVSTIAASTRSWIWPPFKKKTLIGKRQMNKWLNNKKTTNKLGGKLYTAQC